MHHRIDDRSVQLNSAWQGFFFTAILVLGLSAWLGSQTSDKTPILSATEVVANTQKTTDSIDPFDAHLSQSTLSQTRLVTRNNPHPPMVTPTVKVKDLPDLAFASILNTTLTAKPYAMQPFANALGEVSWVSSTTKTANNWANLRASFVEQTNNAATKAVNQLVTLFQPETKPVPKQWVIVLDPGHGGSDPGSQAINGIIEKELTLDIAKRASTFLSELDNVKVVLTRDEDRGMSRWSRVNKVKRSNADVVVSLHFNHLPQTDINLVETYYAGQENIMESQAKQLEEQGKPATMTKASNKQYSFTKQSKRLAKIMQNRVFKEVRKNSPRTIDAGVKQDTLFILTRSFTPGVLIELSCISNAIEANKLSDEAYRTRLAASLADGILDYLRNEIEITSNSDIEV